MTRVLHIDVETFSSIDLKKCGAYRYVEADDFEIMLFGYKWVIDGVPQPRQVVDLLCGERVPDDVFAALTDPSVKKKAFNAAFEILTIGEHYGLALDPAQWQCTMVHALYCGLPGSLGEAAEVLKTKTRKDFRGIALIRVFCVPCKPTKKNGKRTRNYPHHDPERWALFKSYCGDDVDSEYDVESRLEKIPVPQIEWDRWVLDMRMNDHGVRVDLPLVESAIAIDAKLKENLVAEAIKLTGLQNPNSAAQLKKWLTTELELEKELTELNKHNRAYVQSLAGGNEKAEKLLALREELAKASVSKYYAMLRAADENGYVRGLTQFYGAGRTGRAAGRLVQLQNLRKNAMATKPFDELLVARELVRSGDWETLQLLWGSPLDVLSQLIRTALIPDPDCIFAPVDFNAIEARKLAWAADEEWRLEVFRTHGMIYETSAGRMFNVPWETVKKGGVNVALRAKGKVAELALGYEGGAGALERMGALEMGLSYSELEDIKQQWRAANPAIAGKSYRGQRPGFWELMNEAAIRAVRTKKPQEVKHGIEFSVEHNVLKMRLPSGRHLCYIKPSLVDGDYGPEVNFWGQNQVTKQWEKQKSYGGRWCILKDTKVATRRGWVPIQDVTSADEVWDGDAYVRTGGAVYNGERQVGHAHGVWMTPEHLVLTEQGWKRASQSSRFDRAESRVPDGYRVRREQRQKVSLEDALRVRRGSPDRGQRIQEEAATGRASVLRVQGSRTGRREESDTRDDEAPRVRGVEKHARPLPIAVASVVAKLRRAWRSCLRAVENLRALLGRHGSDVPARIVHRPEEQRRRLRAQQLRVENGQAAEQQSQRQCLAGDSEGPVDAFAGGGSVRGEALDSGTQDRAWLGPAPRVGSVYDLLNCGPRNRFVVQGDDGRLLIVHNCENFCQASSRDLLYHKLDRLEQDGLHVYLRFHVHDEVVPSVPIALAEDKLNRIQDIFGEPVPWAPGLPLRGDGFLTPFFRKDD